MVSCRDADIAPAWPAAESVTLTVKVELPDAVGVPAITAVPILALAFRLSPAGRVPEVTCQVKGPLPPLPSVRV